MFPRNSLVFLFFAVCTAQFTSREFCVYIAKYDCLQLRSEFQCGTDGVNYYNDCDFSQAHCRDKDLHRAHMGLCAPSGTANGTAKPPEHGAEIALDIFCLDLFHYTCNDSAPITVCGSDNKTYNNLCEFDKRRCTHRELHILHPDAC